MIESIESIHNILFRHGFPVAAPTDPQPPLPPGPAVMPGPTVPTAAAGATTAAAAARECRGLSQVSFNETGTVPLAAAAGATDTPPAAAVIREAVVDRGASSRPTPHAPRPTVPQSRATLAEALAKTREPRQLTIEEVLGEWTKYDCQATRRALRLGCLAWQWVSQQPDRPAAVQQLRKALADLGITGEAARVNRVIACYWVARLLGADTVELLPLSTVRALCPLVKRDPVTEQWDVRPGLGDLARGLMRQILERHLTAKAIADQVTALRPRKDKPVQPRLVRLDRVISRLPIEEQRELEARLHARLASSAAA